jgi:hypothetical protein
MIITILLKTRMMHWTMNVWKVFDWKKNDCTQLNLSIIALGFPPIDRNDTTLFMDKPPLAAYYVAEAKRQVVSEKEQHAANIYLVECHKCNQFYGYYRYRQLISEIMVLYRDIQDHVDTNGMVTTSESVRIRFGCNSCRNGTISKLQCQSDFIYVP